MRLTPLILTLLLLLGSSPFTGEAAVELSWEGKPPQRIEEVYLLHGVAYLPADDIFPALGLGGYWDSVEHLFRLRLRSGRATFFPGGNYLRLGDQRYRLEHPARFIDGRLRVPESMVTGLLPELLQRRVYYRNLNPPRQLQRPDDEDGLEGLFALLLHKGTTEPGAELSGIFIDPGHGGSDPGVIGPEGGKEKSINLALAQALKKQIRMRMGIPVSLSRDGDYALDQQSRFAAAKAAGADVYLSLHAQSSTVTDQHGLTLYVRPVRESIALGSSRRDASWQLAQALRKSLQEQNWPLITIRTAPLLPLGHGDLPTVMIESGFLSNQEDRQALSDPAEQARLATALQAGLSLYSRNLKEIHP